MRIGKTTGRAGGYSAQIKKTSEAPHGFMHRPRELVELKIPTRDVAWKQLALRQGARNICLSTLVFLIVC